MASVYLPASVLIARVISAIVTDSEETLFPVRVHLCYLAFLPARGCGARRRGTILTPSPSLGCWDLVAMATDCKLPQLPWPLVLAARLP